ncbi:MAG TPA: redoxin family protein [Flavobacteriales bacterium]|nr:redoxin family protein [Flavobacteriales bacterium]HNU57472.1 redoxin family protein [Flavobacteriales bacterium]
MKQGTLLATLTTLICLGSASAQVQNYSVNETVDDFTVTDTDGNVHNLYSITASGKHVILDFFFDTCQPCQQSQPYFNQLHETYGCNDHDLFVISINNGTDNNAAVDAFETTYGGTFRHSPAVGIEGGCAAVDDAFGITAYPTYCLIGPDNKLKNGDIWPISSMQSYVNAFPAASNIQTAQCAAVGVNERVTASLKGLFPVPANTTVNMEISLNSSGIITLEVLDPLGRMVVAEDLGLRSAGAFYHVLDVADLVDGNYAVRLTHNGEPAGVHKLMIAR